MVLITKEHNIRHSAWPYLAICQVPAQLSAYLPPGNGGAFHHPLLVGAFYLYGAVPV